MSEFESVRLLVFIGATLLVCFVCGKQVGYNEGYHIGYDDGRLSVTRK